MNEEPKPQKPPDNDVHSPKFESKIDPYFTEKTKTKDHWSSRAASMKIEGKWT